MAVTPGQLRTRLPVFAAKTDAEIQEAIDEAELRINRTAWTETKADKGVIYLAGHILQKDTEAAGGGAGPVSSMRDGGLAKTFAIPQAFKDEPEASTAFGVRYLELRMTVFADRRI